MNVQFSQNWIKTQKAFRVWLEDPPNRKSWDQLLTSLETAEIRSHKASKTGNHVDIRIAFDDTIAVLHVGIEEIDCQTALQSVLGSIIAKLIPEICQWLSSTMTKEKEWSIGQKHAALAEPLYDDALQHGNDFCDKLNSYIQSCCASAETAKRKHIREAALRDARPLIGRAIANGCDPQVLIDYIHTCVVEEVLDA